MQVYRIRVLLAFGVLFALAGCKSADVAPAKVPPPPPSPPSVTLNVDTDDKTGHDNGGPEVHSAGLAQNSQVTWVNQSNFTVTFTSPDNIGPCIQASPITATQDTTSASPRFTATCTIMKPPSANPTKYHYRIDPAPGNDHKPAKKKGGQGPGSGNPDHCEGCVIDN